MSCNCTTPCTSTCPSYCGCTVQVPGTCVFYQGSNLTCIDATKGDTYDSILANINDIVCDLLPPSGLPDYVGVAGEIVITGNVIGLDSAITTAISNAQTDITNLQNCGINSVKNIVSGSPNIAIVPTSVGSCGRTLSISFVPTPVSNSQKQGIIYNILSPVNISDGDYINHDLSSYVLGAGDIIKFKGNLKRTADPIVVEQGYTISGGIPLNINTMNSLGGSSIYNTIDDFEIILSVISNTSGTLNVRTYGVFDTLAQKSGIPPSDRFTTTFASPKRIFQFSSTINLNETSVQIAFSNPGITPVMQQYFVEIIRKI